MNIQEAKPQNASPLGMGRLRQLDLNLLVTLEALLTHQSVTRAAEELALTQPTISHALGRLRQHFKDELIVASGRRMVLTPLATTLAAPLRNILIQMNTLIAQRPTFDPSVSDWSLMLSATDYFFTVLAADVLRQVAREAPNMNIVVDTSKHDLRQRLERGAIDMAAGVLGAAIPGHPAEVLFEDTHVCVVWTGNPLVGDQISLDQYLSLKHVVWRVNGSSERSPKEELLRSLGYLQKVACVTTAMEMVPQLIVGTNHIACICRRAAEYYARFLPIRIVPSPIEFPKMSVIVQWHRHRDADPALQWFLSTLRACARTMPPAETHAKSLTHPQYREIRVSPT